MKYLPLLWSGLRRRPFRTILIVLQAAIALGLFAVLQGVETGTAAWIARTQADLLMVRSLKPGSLPLADRYPLRKMQDVRAVAYQNYLPATYERPNQHVTAIAIDFGPAQKVLPVKMSPALVREQRATMDGAVATPALAQRFGWKPGDRIHLETTLPLKKGHDMGFTFLGTFIPVQANGTSEMIVFNNRYLDALRAVGRGTVEGFDVRVTNPKYDNQVARRIDAYFRDSPFPTRTQSFRELAQTNLKRIEDMQFEVRAVTAAAFFSLLISIGSIFFASSRERSIEMAVMKAIGFRNGNVAGVLLAESLVVCGIGAAIGFAASSIVFAKAQVMLLGLSMPWIVLIEGLGLACGVACLTTALPIWRVLKMDVSEALGAL